MGVYTYGTTPHAVTQVSGTLNTTYTYDANGNMTGGNGRAITYTSYNAPSQIVTSSATVSFVYDADHQRLRQTSTSGTMIYLNPRIDAGAHFEKETKGGVTTYKHYLYGSAGVIGTYSTTSTTAVTEYFHSDHLGSIVAVTDDSANVLARYKFDTWGKRIPLAGDPTTTHHGFTGHEHLDDVGLIDMNGRVYDPVLGRFMSADPYIQAPDNLQSYNRYSYVWNNPLSATDPSGYWKLGKWLSAGTKWFFLPTPKNTFAAIRSQPGQVQVDQYMLTHQWAYAVGQIVVTAYGGPYGAAAYSAYYSYVATGSTTQAVRAGAIAYVTAEASSSVDAYYGDTWSWGRVAANSVVGGVSSELQGGNFMDGFKNAFIFSTLTYANYAMREAMIESSRLDPLSGNANGESAGFFRDHFKLGGARAVWDGEKWLPCTSPLGGCQGGPGSLIFFGDYKAGGVLDHLVESYAGPHDFLNSGYWYNELGNGKNLTGFAKGFGEGLNALNVVIATPFAAAALVTTTPGGLSAAVRPKTADVRQ